MNRIAAHLALALLATAVCAGSTDARADAAKPSVGTQASSSQLPRAVKQARVETGNSQAFIINGKRVFVPANDNAVAVIKALKDRYPGLKPDTGLQGMAAAN
jgi:hypothetical protein